MVNAVVGHIVGQVARGESGRVGPGPGSKQQPGQRQQQNRNRETQGNWHHQAFFVIRVLMMHTMKQETNAFLKLAFGCEMKHVPVKKIFKQGPKRHPRQKQYDKRGDRYVDRKTFPDKENDNRQIHREHRYR